MAGSSAVDRSQQFAAAQEALARHDWAAADQLLRPLAERDSADAEVLAAFADTAWWLGRLDECITARERAYALHEAAGERHRAARLASRLFDDHCFAGRRIVAQAWVSRAVRLLQHEDDCAERGVVLLREVEIAASRGDLGTARHAAERALELGRTLGDVDLEAESLQALGRLLTDEGLGQEGLALYDEAMLLATQGRLSPFVTGKVYCSLISACEELGDLERAAEWTDVGLRWAADHPLAVFPGLCRVHRARVLQLRGHWDQAEREARTACDELSDLNLANAARAFYEIGEIHRRQGDLSGAEDAFRRVAEFGGHNQPGLALLRLAQGRVVAAAAGIAQALGETSNRLSRAPLLAAHVEVAVAAGDPDAARDAADELEGIAADFAGPMLRAAAWTARGRVELAQGDAPVACRFLRRALTEWQALAAAYEVATTRLLLGMACRGAGDGEAAAVCLDTAAAEFRRLGVAPTGPPGPPGRRRLPGGLTEREAQVLRLVATGASNKDIAASLCLSRKTVARHLSNIFVKLGVSSRVAATSYAFEHGLTPAGRRSPDFPDG